MRTWRCGDHRLPLGGRTLIMGVVNVTPDSFSDGGERAAADAAVEHGRRLTAEGADVVDVGGESTRPGAAPVPIEEEARRVVPVVRALAAAGLCVSVDTRRVEVARAALEAGASVVNDVSAFASAGMAEVVAEHGAGCVLMHMRGEPGTMQDDPRYADVVREVRDHLAARAKAAEAAGVRHDAIALDPGLGFGKTFDHNLALLRELPALAALGHPLLVGHSRKSFVGRLLDDGRGPPPPRDRLEGDLALAAIVSEHAAILRVHDVGATARALRVADGLRGRR